MFATRAKIDYLAFSARGGALPYLRDAVGYDLAQLVLEHTLHSLGVPLSALPAGAIGRGRGGYRFAWNMGTGARAFAGHPTSPPYVEFTGSALDSLREHVSDPEIAALTADTASRLDLCTDISTDTRPSEFVASMASKRAYARSQHVSISGETQYIGSPSSDRMCRVYRYAEPHPRAAFLRVEVQLRSLYARHYATQTAIRGAYNALLDATATYSFTSPLWRQVDARTAVARTYPDDARNARLLRFWYKTCVPVQNKLKEAGLLE